MVEGSGSEPFKTSGGVAIEFFVAAVCGLNRLILSKLGLNRYAISITQLTRIRKLTTLIRRCLLACPTSRVARLD